MIQSKGSERFVWHQDALVRLPKGMQAVLTHPLTKPLAFRGMKEAMFSYRSATDIPLGRFMQSKFGSEGEILIGAMTAGIFAGDANKLSTASCFPDLIRLEQQGRGSLVRGILMDYFNKQDVFDESVPMSLATSSSLSFKQGMKQLSEALMNSCRLKGVTIHLNEKVLGLEKSRSSDCWTLNSPTACEEFDFIVSTVAPYNLLRILQRPSPAIQQLSNLIGNVDVAVVNLALSSKLHQLPLNGFGHLVADSTVQHDTGCLGVIYDSVSFPEQQSTDLMVVTVMLGGAHARWISGETPDSLLQFAVSAVKQQLVSDAHIVDSSVSLHRSCIPQYHVGHRVAAQTAVAEMIDDNFLILGNSIAGVGIADSIGSTLTELAKLSRLKKFVK